MKKILLFAAAASISAAFAAGLSFQDLKKLETVDAPDFVLLKQVFAPEADIFCFIFLPAQKTFRFKCDLVYGQDISSGEHWTAAETAALEAAVNRIVEKMFQTAG